MVHVMLPKAMMYYIYISCSIISNTRLVTLRLMKYMNLHLCSNITIRTVLLNTHMEYTKHIYCT